MKVFFAIPYSQLCDENYELKKEYRIFLERLTTETKKLGIEYFLAHERENWGKNYSSDVESTEIDFKTITNCDLVCIIPGIPNSGGVHVEIGWASSANRNLRIFLNKNHSYSPTVTGIYALTNTKYYYYDKEFSDELLNMMISSIKKEMENYNE